MKIWASAFTRRAHGIGRWAIAFFCAVTSTFAQPVPPLTVGETIEAAAASGAPLIYISQSAEFTKTLKLKNCRMICEPGVTLSWKE